MHIYRLIFSLSLSLQQLPIFQTPPPKKLLHPHLLTRVSCLKTSTYRYLCVWFYSYKILEHHSTQVSLSLYWLLGSEEEAMQSDYEMAGIHHQQPQVEEQQQQHRFMVENNASTSSPFFPINPSYHFPHPLVQHIPMTQQFLQYQHPHYRSMLDHQEQLVQGSFFSIKGEIRGGQEDALIRGSEGYCTQPRQTSIAVWQNQEDSAIKQPFWKPLSAEFSNGNNNKESENNNKQEENQEMYPPKEIHHQEANKRRMLFGELEAIYADNTNADIHRIASESVLTVEDLPMSHNVSFPELALNNSNQATAMATTAATGIDNIGSECASVGGREAEATRGDGHKRKRAKESRTTTSMSRFFESLMKKLAKHQEGLQRSFMETIERLDQERKEREQVWREQELIKLQKEAAVRAHERSLASNREAALVSYLEKLTGQKINFQPFNQEDSSLAKLNNKRWPQAEVEALIHIRTSLESKFREPGTPKGLLWEEISNSMASMGFKRNARRCKEKWENMQKYTVKRTKEFTREQLNSSTATVDFVNQGNDTIVDHLATVSNLSEGNADEKDKHENGSKEEDMEEYELKDNP